MTEPEADVQVRACKAAVRGPGRSHAFTAFTLVIRLRFYFHSPPVTGRVGVHWCNALSGRT